MVVWSSLGRSIFGLNKLRYVQSPVSLKVAQNAIQIRNGGDHGPRVFTITPSRWQWHRFKDLLHFYLMLGLIPVTAILLYVNIFIGPATLTEIPEDYVPKHWEYYRHPLQRFVSRYIHSPPQQEYEKLMHVMYEEWDKGQIRGLERKIRQRMAENQDYQGWYYRPVIAKYWRISKEVADELESLAGD